MGNPVWVVHGRLLITFTLGALANSAGVFVFLWSIAAGNLALIIVSTVLLKRILYSTHHAPWPSLYAEMFSMACATPGSGWPPSPASSWLRSRPAGAMR